MPVSEPVDELGVTELTEGPTTNSALAEIERAVSEIGAKVAVARADRGWSLAQLATRADLSTATVHKVERGAMTPSIAVLMKLAAALGRSVAHFIDETDVQRDVSVVRSGDQESIPTTKHGLALRTGAAQRVRPGRRPTPRTPPPGREPTAAARGRRCLRLPCTT